MNYIVPTSLVLLMLGGCVRPPSSFLEARLPDLPVLLEVKAAGVQTPMRQHYTSNLSLVVLAAQYEAELDLLGWELVNVVEQDADLMWLVAHKPKKVMTIVLRRVSSRATDITVLVGRRR